MFAALQSMGNVTKCVVFCTLIICVTVSYNLTVSPDRPAHVKKLESDVADLQKSQDAQDLKISELRSAIVELEEQVQWKPVPGPGGRQRIGSVGSAPGVGSAPEPQPTLADPK